MPCAFPKCRRDSYARGLCRGHYAQEMRGRELHPLRDPEAPARVVLSIRVSKEAKARADEAPDAVRRVIERWARR